MARLSRDFFDRDTLTVSRELLGKYLCRRLESGELLALRLTETEAYIGRCDKACHAYGGRRTARTEPLFLPPGHAYIYLIYGMYHCLNLVTEPEGEPAAGTRSRDHPYLAPHRHRLRPGGGPLPLAVLDGGITCTFLT